MIMTKELYEKKYHEALPTIDEVSNFLSEPITEAEYNNSISVYARRKSEWKNVNEFLEWVKGVTMYTVNQTAMKIYEIDLMYEEVDMLEDKLRNLENEIAYKERIFGIKAQF